MCDPVELKFFVNFLGIVVFLNLIVNHVYFNIKGGRKLHISTHQCNTNAHKERFRVNTALSAIMDSHNNKFRGVDTPHTIFVDINSRQTELSLNKFDVFYLDNDV